MGKQHSSVTSNRGDDAPSGNQNRTFFGSKYRISVAFTILVYRSDLPKIRTEAKRCLTAKADSYPYLPRLPTMG